MRNTVDPAARRDAHEKLTTALLALTVTGRRPRCGDPPDHRLWTSELVAELHEAARRCAGCPVTEACAAGASERWGVWGAQVAGSRDETEDRPP